MSHSDVPTLLIATTSPGKIREFRQLLAELPAKLVTPTDLGLSLDVEETGSTFRENAEIKARAYAAASDLPTLAEDSGLKIEAFGGEPGVYSARWGGTDDYAAKNRLILQRLLRVPWEQRGCRYISEAVVLGPDGAPRYGRGEVRGFIALVPAGDGGFGYDPIFYLPRYRRTMAQLTAEEKHQISHRGRSTRRILPALRRVLGLGPNK